MPVTKGLRFPRMVRVLMLITLIFGLTSLPQAQTDPDLTGGTPPPQIPDRPLGLELPELAQSYHLIINQNCADPDGPPTIAITYERDVVTFSAGADDSTVYLNIGFREYGALVDRVLFPQERFKLLVIKGNDTARYAVEYCSDDLNVQSLDRKPFVLLEHPQNLPERTIWVQFYGHISDDRLRDYLDQINLQIGDSARVVTLQDGYYRCIPDFVWREGIGRRRRVNATVLGPLIFVTASTHQPDIISSKLASWAGLLRTTDAVRLTVGRSF